MSNCRLASVQWVREGEQEPILHLRVQKRGGCLDHGYVLPEDGRREQVLTSRDDGPELQQDILRLHNSRIRVRQSLCSARGNGLAVFGRGEVADALRRIWCACSVERAVEASRSSQDVDVGGLVVRDGDESARRTAIDQLHPKHLGVWE